MQPIVAQIGWSHNLIILQKCKDDLEREFYLRMTRKFGWTEDGRRRGHRCSKHRGFYLGNVCAILCGASHAAGSDIEEEPLFGEAPRWIGLP